MDDHKVSGHPSKVEMLSPTLLGKQVGIPSPPILNFRRELFAWSFVQKRKQEVVSNERDFLVIMFLYLIEDGMIVILTVCMRRYQYVSQYLNYL